MRAASFRLPGCLQHQAKSTRLHRVEVNIRHRSRFTGQLALVVVRGGDGLVLEGDVGPAHRRERRAQALEREGLGVLAAAGEDDRAPHDDPRAERAHRLFGAGADVGQEHRHELDERRRLAEDVGGLEGAVGDVRLERLDEAAAAIGLEVVVDGAPASDGLQAPTRGMAYIMGKPVLGEHDVVRHHVGFAPDSPPAYEDLTIDQFLRFIAGAYRLAPNATDERIGFWLDQLWLVERRHSLVKHLSKGMRQRVLFAQAMLARPPLILMDEPTNGLDPYWMESFVQLTREAATRGQTIIFSTHQLQIAEALADEIYFLQSGVVKMSDTPAQIREQMGAAGMEDAFARLFGLPSVR